MTQVLIDRATLEQLVDALAVADNIALVGSAYTPKAIDTGVRQIREAITAGRAALAKAEPAGWKPIETAPKDGTSFMAGWFDWPSNPGCNMCPVKWHMGAWWESGEDDKVRTPTHWMPLPAAPKATP